MKYIFPLLLTILTAVRANACDATISQSDTICYYTGGTYDIVFTGSGGVAPYTFVYSVNGGSTQTITSVGTGDSAVLNVPMPGLGNVNYTLVSVLDANGCIVTVNQSSNFLFVTNPSGNVSGTTTVYQNSTPFPEFVLTGSGGIPPYTFKYTINGGPQQTITSPPGSSSVQIPISTATVGTYTLELTHIYSSYLCQSLPTTGITGSTATITVIPNPMTVSGTNQTVCAGAASAEFSFSASGSTGPYTYSYTVGGVPQTITGGSPITIPASTTVAGTTTCQLTGITDSYGNYQAVNASSSVTVSPPPTGMVSISGGCGTYTVFLSASGGSGPFVYNFVLQGVPTTVTGGSTMSVTYTSPHLASSFPMYVSGVSVTNAAGCTGPLTISGSNFVTIPAYANYSITATTTTACVGSANPVLTFSCSGCSGTTFIYSVNGGPNQSVSNGSGSSTVSVPTTSAGTYNYILYGTSGQSPCSSGPSQQITVVVKALPTATISGTATVCKSATSPVVTFTGSNGTPPYVFTYNINGGANQTVSSGNSSATASINVSTVNPGTYTYNIVSVSSAAGCSQNQTGSAVVTVNPPPTASITGTVTVCKNATQPVITFTGADGTAPYTFTYKLNGGANQTISSGTGATATINVPTSTTGTFTYSLVSVSSAAGCSQTQTGSATVIVSPLPTATISGSAMVCQNDASPSVTFAGAGGTAPYTFSYNINGGATQTISSTGASIALNAPTGTTGIFTYNLVSVSSANGCSQTQTGGVTVIVNPSATATISGSATVCQGSATQTVTFTGANGTAPYTFTYKLNGGANQTISSGTGSTATINVPTSTTGTFTYSLVSVYGANGCPQNQTGSAIIVVNPASTATISGSATVCQNSATPAITFTGANGTAPYTFNYTINGGAVQTISSTGASAVLNAPTATTGTFTYNLVSVSGTGGCLQAQTGSVTVVVNPTATATISGSATVCQNAATQVITFTGANGTAPYTFTYKLNGGTNQTISSGTGSTATLTVPTNTAGTFSYSLVSVSGANGCPQNQTGSAVIVVNPASTATISGSATVCQNSATPAITLTGVNGTAPYTFNYTINGGAVQTISSTGSSAVLNAPTATAGTFTYNLVSVANTEGCSQNQSGSAVITVNALPTASISGNTSVCVNNPTGITLEGFGGSAPYTFTYTINGGAAQTVSSGTGSTTVISVPVNAAGTYTYDLTHVSNASGCSQNQSGSLNVSVNGQPLISGTASVCQGAVIQLSASGTPATSPWSSSNPAIATVSATGVVTGVSAGNASITFTNAAGCSASQSIQVLGLPTASISGNTTICAGNTVNFTISGTPGSTVTYTDGISTGTTTIPASGSAIISSPVLFDTTSYTLLNVQAACSQSLSGAIVINVNEIPAMNPLTDLTVCAREFVQMPSFSGTNGTTFNWTNTNSSVGLANTGTGNIPVFAALNNLATPQSAIISVTPSLNGCTGTSESFTLTINDLPVADAGANQSACLNDNTIHSIGSASIPGNTYSWSPGTNLSSTVISNPEITTVSAGTTSYVVTVTNNSGCQNTDTVMFTGTTTPVASLSSSSPFSCENGLVSFHLDTVGSLNIEWYIDGVLSPNTNQTDWSTRFETSGTHAVSVLVTNASGCTAMESLSGGVQVYPGVQAAFTTGLNSTIIDEFTDHLDLVNLSENASVYDWYVNGTWSSAETNPTLTFTAGTGTLEIVLVAANQFGCSDTASLTIESFGEGVVYVPNSFTPNGDGVNELFIPVISDEFSLDHYLFEIYNRWGERIFSTTDRNAGWNGTYLDAPCKTDVYIWKVNLKSKETGFAESLEGHVNLQR